RRHAEAVLRLADEDDAGPATREGSRRIEEGLPVSAVGKPSFQLDQEGGGEGFGVQLAGDSTERLNELAADVARVLASVPGLTDIRSVAESGERVGRCTIARASAAAVGLSTCANDAANAIHMRG